MLTHVREDAHTHMRVYMYLPQVCSGCVAGTVGGVCAVTVHRATSLATTTAHTHTHTHTCLLSLSGSF